MSVMEDEIFPTDHKQKIFPRSSTRVVQKPVIPLSRLVDKRIKDSQLMVIPNRDQQRGCLQQSSTVRLHEDARVARQKQVVDSPKVIGLGQIQPRGFRASPMGFGRS